MVAVQGSNTDVNSDHISTFSNGLRIFVDTQPKQAPFIRRIILRIDKCLETLNGLVGFDTDAFNHLTVSKT